MMPSDVEKLRRLVAGRLESLHAAGVLQLAKVRPREPASSPIETPDRLESASVPTAAPAAQPHSRPSAARSAGWNARGGALFDGAESAVGDTSSAPTLEVLAQEVAACTRCDVLARCRTQTVFGVGNPQARLCFLGEAPGRDEDEQGEPFVGRAGQLLNKIIEACRMRREDVYICNILKCRPPDNRNPEPSEAANCRRFLERQLELVAPEFICCLGAVAAQNLLGTAQSIGKLRGKIHAYRGAKVICTYHPAYLLRNPGAKKDTWEDMKLLMGEMGADASTGQGSN
jgi:DNA polymerase